MKRFILPWLFHFSSVSAEADKESCSIWIKFLDKSNLSASQNKGFEDFLGVPKVTCLENDLAVDVVTAKPFQGNIFVKGRAKEPTCRQSYATNSSSVYILSLGKCGMQRLRSVSNGHDLLLYKQNVTLR